MKIGDEIVGPVKQAWHRFIERTSPLRPELFRYCRWLTGTVWDAEDLVQDTLLRAFARLSEASQPIENARSYLFRIASNLWIDKFRGTREFPSDKAFDLAQTELAQPDLTDLPHPLEIRDAARHLLTHLPPMERAAVLLKDVFDLSLEETATALDTTVGAVKAALHRGRAKLAAIAPEDSEKAPVQSVETQAGAELLDRFVEAFNARDLDRLTAMMREDATSEMLGMLIEYGRDAIAKNGKGVLHHTFASHPSRDEWWAERHNYKGEPIILFRTTETGQGVITSMLRIEQRDGSIARLRYYFFCPETLTEVCAELGLPVKNNGYRPSWN